MKKVYVGDGGVERCASAVERVDGLAGKSTTVDKSPAHKQLHPRNHNHLLYADYEYRRFILEWSSD
jgi:hypothetical protein